MRAWASALLYVGVTMRSRDRAFTLVETLIVVVIVGIAAVVVVPQLGSQSGLRAASGARLLMSDLMYAQSRAISQQKNVYVVFDVAAQNYQLFVGSPMVAMTHPVTKDPYLVQFDSIGMNEVALDSAAFGSTPTLVFDSLGVPHSADGAGVLQDMTANGEIIIRSGDKALHVEVSAFTGETGISGS